MVQHGESREKAAFKEIEKKLGEAGSDQADIAELNREKNELTEISQRLE